MIKKIIDSRLKTIFSAVSDKKGENLVILDLKELSGFTDFFAITHGNSTRQVNAIAEEVRLRLKKDFGVLPLHSEGESTGEWILLDYGDIVFHAFLENKRYYYNLEKIWGDAIQIPLADLIAKPGVKKSSATKAQAKRKPLP